MSQCQTSSLTDKQTICDFQFRIQEQKARLQRMIAQGTIGLADDDLLAEMYATLREMQVARVRDTR